MDLLHPLKLETHHMPNTPSEGGACPFAAYLMEVVEHEGLFVTRRTAMDVCFTLDQDEDLLRRMAEKPPVEALPPGATVSSIHDAFVDRANQDWSEGLYPPATSLRT